MLFCYFYSYNKSYLSRKSHHNSSCRLEDMIIFFFSITCFHQFFGFFKFFKSLLQRLDQFPLKWVGPNWLHPLKKKNLLSKIPALLRLNKCCILSLYYSYVQSYTFCVNDAWSNTHFTLPMQHNWKLMANKNIQ